MQNRIRTADQQVTGILENQHGAITGAQALGAGLTQRQIDLRAEAGVWIRPTRSVFVLAGSPDTWHQRAWVAFRDAAGRWRPLLRHLRRGVLSLRPSLLPHVTVPPTHSGRCRVAKVHRGVIPVQDRQHRDGLLVTTPSRLLVDMAGCLARQPLEELVDDTLCRGLASARSVEASLERAGGGHRGHPLLRQVLEGWSPEIEPGSVAEMRLLRLLGELGVGDLAMQYEVFDNDGVFVARLDLARPHLRKGLEYDNTKHHGPRRWAHDEARYER